VKLGKKRRESSKRNYYIISPRVTIKAIIITATGRVDAILGCGGCVLAHETAQENITLPVLPLCPTRVRRNPDRSTTYIPLLNGANWVHIPNAPTYQVVERKCLALSFGYTSNFFDLDQDHQGLFETEVRTLRPSAASSLLPSSLFLAMCTIMNIQYPCVLNFGARRRGAKVRISSQVFLDFTPKFAISHGGKR